MESVRFRSTLLRGSRESGRVYKHRAFWFANSTLVRSERKMNVF